MNGMEQSMMAPQGGPPQGGPPQQEAPQQPKELNQEKLFPASEEEADALESMALNMLYDEKVGMQIIEMIGQQPTIEEGVGKATAMLVMKTLITVTQNTGRDIDPDFMDELADVVMKEIFRVMFVSKMIKKQPSKKMLMDVGEIAFQMIQQMIEAQAQQEQQGQQGQQGPPQQGPPQPQQGPPQQGPPQGGPSMMA